METQFAAEYNYDDGDVSESADEQDMQADNSKVSTEPSTYMLDGPASGIPLVFVNWKRQDIPTPPGETLNEKFNACIPHEPVIGLDYIYEYHPDEFGNCSFECKLCNVTNLCLDDMFRHIVGIQHKIVYMQLFHADKGFHGRFKVKRGAKQKSPHYKKLMEVSHFVEKAYGRKKTNLSMATFDPAKLTGVFLCSKCQVLRKNYLMKSLPDKQNKSEPSIVSAEAQGPYQSFQELKRAYEAKMREREARGFSHSSTEFMDFCDRQPIEFLYNEELYEYLSSFKTVNDENVIFIMNVAVRLSNILAEQQQKLADQQILSGPEIPNTNSSIAPLSRSSPSRSPHRSPTNRSPQRKLPASRSPQRKLHASRSPQRKSSPNRAGMSNRNRGNSRRSPPNKKNSRRSPPNKKNSRRSPPNKKNSRRSPPNKKNSRRSPPNRESLRRSPPNRESLSRSPPTPTNSGMSPQNTPNASMALSSKSTSSKDADGNGPFNYVQPQNSAESLYKNSEFLVTYPLNVYPASWGNPQRLYPMKKSMWDFESASNKPQDNKLNETQNEDNKFSKTQNEGYAFNKQQTEDYAVNKQQTEDYAFNKQQTEDYAFNKQQTENYAFNKQQTEGYAFNKQQTEGYAFNKQQTEGYAFNKQQNEGYAFNKQENEGYPFNKQENEGYPFNKQENEGYPFNKQENEGYTFNKQENEGYSFNKQENEGYAFNKQENEGYAFNKQENEGYAFNKQENEGYAFNKQENEGSELSKQQNQRNKFNKTQNQGNKFNKQQIQGNKFNKQQNQGNKFNKQQNQGNKFNKQQNQGNKFNKQQNQGNKFNKTKPSIQQREQFQSTPKMPQNEQHNPYQQFPAASVQQIEPMLFDITVDLPPGVPRNAVTAKFFQSIQNMDSSDVVPALNKLSFTNPAFKGINVPLVIWHLTEAGVLKNT
ncbi:probable serine/threonine-protein kinase yakA [Bombina bombina]|uniref:probable serine/threonine-protein kinase yakA n=1 Tax=Bombina bombina TaxID=8345 RepID=UPI00235AABD4|nr:probable serine/threonine-protein kinase yakA [Bombina bombina]